MLADLSLTLASGVRALEVRILPVADGATLLWHDVTERTHAEQALKRSDERLALAAEGANDGLWEWDLRTQEFYVSGGGGRCSASPNRSGRRGPASGSDRVHPEDVGPLREALERASRGSDRSLPARAPDSPRGRHLPPVPVPGRRGARRRAARPRIAGSLTDTTEQALAQERLRSAGFRDPLTGLCNRAVFVEGLGRRLEEFKQRAAATGSRCSISTSIASRSSTTASATWSATSC